MVHPLSKTPGYADPSKVNERFVEKEAEPQNQPETPEVNPLETEGEVVKQEAPQDVRGELQETPDTDGRGKAEGLKPETDVQMPTPPSPIDTSVPSMESILSNLTKEPEELDVDLEFIPILTERPSQASTGGDKKAPKQSVLARLTSQGSSGASSDLREGIIQSAQALGVDPVELATAISYETAGTFNPKKKGPRTKWGQHRGLIQFGEPQARQYGVDWSDPVRSQLGPNGAVVKYLKAVGVKPGMGLLQIYSAINAGGIGEKYYGRTDRQAGGAPGTVRQKVENQMGGHRTKASRLLGL